MVRKLTLPKVLTLAVILAASLCAQQTTTVTGTLKVADGAAFTGYLEITWPAFTSPEGYLVPRGTKNVSPIAGAISTPLYPTPSGVVYRVVYVNGNQRSQPEYWAVPVSASPVTIASVITNLPTSTPSTVLALSLLSSSGASAGHTIVFNGTVAAWRSKGYVDVRDYGATGNGTTDDTTAILAAISAATGGGSVFLPKGTYIVSSSVIVNQTNVSLVGAGMGATTIKRAAGFTTGILLRLTASGATAQDVTLDGNESSVLYSEAAAAAANTVIDRVEIIGNNHIAIEIAASNVRITNCRLTGRNSATYGNVGIWFDSTSVNGLLIANNTVTAQRWGAIFGSGKNVRITGNYLSGNHVQVSPGGGQIAIKNVATNENIVVSNNTIGPGGGAQTTGIEIGMGLGDNGPGPLVIGNTIFGQTWSGIVLQSGTDTQVIGNVVRNSGTSGLNQPGIKVGVDIGQFQIVGNRVYDDQSPQTQTFGVSVAAGTSDNYVIANNDLRGNLTAGLYDGGTGTNKQIYGNIPEQELGGMRGRVIGPLRYSLITSSSTIADTTNATSFDKSFSIPTGALTAGAVLRVEASGLVSTSGTPTLQLRLRIGGTNFAGNTITTPNNASSAAWSLNGGFTVRTVGSSGSAFRFPSEYRIEPTTRSTGGQGAFAINTTTANTLDVQVTWGTASASNTITLLALNVWIEYPAATQ